MPMRHSQASPLRTRPPTVASPSAAGNAGRGLCPRIVQEDCSPKAEPTAVFSTKSTFVGRSTDGETAGRTVLPAGWALLVLPVAVLAVPVSARAAEPAPCAAPAFAAKVSSAVSPTELVLEDGRRLRLAGVALPSLPSEATERARQALDAAAAGRAARITPMAGVDRWGRIAADISLEAADGGGFPGAEGEAQGRDLAAALVSDGILIAFPEAENVSCDRRAAHGIAAAEGPAREARRGVWNPDARMVRDAGDPTLSAAAGRLTIVEGVVQSVGHAGRTYFLNFGARWTLDFTVTIAESDLEGHRADGIDIAGLAGARVRVRGWIEDDGGALIALAAPGTIERAEAAVDAPSP